MYGISSSPKTCDSISSKSVYTRLKQVGLDGSPVLAARLNEIVTIGFGIVWSTITGLLI